MYLKPTKIPKLIWDSKHFSQKVPASKFASSIETQNEPQSTVGNWLRLCIGSSHASVNA